MPAGPSETKDLDRIELS